MSDAPRPAHRNPSWGRDPAAPPGSPRRAVSGPTSSSRRHRLERACLRWSTRETPRPRCRAIRPERPSARGASAPSSDGPCPSDIPRRRHRDRTAQVPTAGMPINSDGVAESEWEEGSRPHPRRTAGWSGLRSPVLPVEWLPRLRLESSPSPRPRDLLPQRSDRPPPPAEDGRACLVPWRRREACGPATRCRACLGSTMTWSRPRAQRLPLDRPSLHRRPDAGSRRSMGSQEEGSPKPPTPIRPSRLQRSPRPRRPRPGPLLHRSASRDRRGRRRLRQHRQLGLRRRRAGRTRIPMPFSIE